MPLPTHNTPDIAEQAAWWFSRWRNGELPIPEQRRLEAWLGEDVRHRHEFDQLHAIWEAAGDLAESPIVHAERFLPAARPAWRRTTWQPLLAALLLVVSASGAILWFFAEPVPPALLTVTSRHGERKQLALDDGSRLFLDADTAITLRSTPTLQRVVLEHGAIYCEVPHRPERRFEVMAGDLRIADIGTQFGVRRQGGGVVVAVTEGEIEVQPKNGGVSRLIAGQGANLDDTGRHIGAIDVDAAFAWHDGRLVFDRTPLAEAVAVANHYRRQPLVIADPALEMLPMSGTFNIDDPQGLLWAIQQALPLRAIPRENRIDLVAR